MNEMPEDLRDALAEYDKVCDDFNLVEGDMIFVMNDRLSAAKTKLNSYIQQYKLQSGQFNPENSANTTLPWLAQAAGQ